jgi:dolichol-phosphate mannosyltransferase
MELSVVIPAWREADNLGRLLPQLHGVLSTLDGNSPSAVGSGSLGSPRRGIAYEIIVVDNHSADGTAEVCAAEGATLVQQTAPGYGGALRAGFEHARGEYVLTMDADLSHEPDFVREMWQRRVDGEVVIASRYVEGGGADMPWYREILSIILNTVYTKVLDLPFKDISSGFRLYQASALSGLDLQSNDFDALEEILIKCYARGNRIIEIPFRYVPRVTGESKVKLWQFGVSYLRTLLRMWRLRNSVASADYDARAYDSVIPLQRYWQRARYHIVQSMVDVSKPCLDIGCGSSRILGALDQTSVGLDVVRGKLLYSRCYGRSLTQGSAFALPFADDSFPQVICSQVIEHLEAGEGPFQEMARVIKDGGLLVLGTPDYSRASWRIIERLYKLFAPDAYGDEHITHYGRDQLVQMMAGHGFRLKRVQYVGGSELICLFEKLGSE